MASGLPFLLSTATALHSSQWKYAVKETHPIPRGWTHITNAPAGHIVKMDIALKQSQFDQLEHDLYEGML